MKATLWQYLQTVKKCAVWDRCVCRNIGWNLGTCRKTVLIRKWMHINKDYNFSSLDNNFHISILIMITIQLNQHFCIYTYISHLEQIITLMSKFYDWYDIPWNMYIFRFVWLWAHKQLEMYVCIISIVGPDAMVLKHQASESKVLIKYSSFWSSFIQKYISREYH